ncbi:MAG: hypothetical protein Q8P15_04205 [Nanoarchaeota archaeon]|nr:hypothetical protein [Nanoarchaeota archaeon]
MAQTPPAQPNMEQQTKPVQKNNIQKPMPARTTNPMSPQTMPNQPANQQMTEQPNEEKSKWWIWVIVAVVVLAVIATVYFWIF